MRDDIEYYNENITEDIVNNWENVYRNKIENLNLYIKNLKERLAATEKRIEEYRQKQTDFANGQYKDTLENVINLPVLGYLIALLPADDIFMLLKKTELLKKN